MNTCPKCGLIQGLQFSVLPGCKCQWQVHYEPYMYTLWDESKNILYVTRAPFSTIYYIVRIEKVKK